jgi:mRNA interferase HigB
LALGRILARRALREFWERDGCGDAEKPLQAWFKEAEAADWKSPADIKARYASASFLNGDRVVFNIGGNKYRLIVRVKYGPSVVLIRFIGTHSEYDAIDASEV